VVIPEVPLSLRGSVRFGSSEVLLHWRAQHAEVTEHIFSLVTL
jgi:hypothetical protein